MRLMQFATPRGGPARPFPKRWIRFPTPGRHRLTDLGVVCLLVLAGASSSIAQEEPAAAPPPAADAPKATATQLPAATASAPIPLSHYVPRDNLILYVEFAGIARHDDEWRKTAAYKLLNSTPLGEMLEEVSAQLLENLLGNLPNRKVNGTELVTLCKVAAKGGWALALNANQKGANPFAGTLILRGAATQGNKPLTSRLIGTIMGADAKPRIERKSGRVTVVVPGDGAPDSGWVWWPEKEDLVVGFMQPSNADAIIAAIDGNSPSAADHQVLGGLAKVEGGFRPVMTALLDPAAAPAEPKTRLFEVLAQLRNTVGLNRVEYRWGFDGDALMGETRLVAPSPRKPILAIFDQPKLDTKKLIPVPEGVDSFVMLSASPAKIVEAVGQLGSSGSAKAKIDELYEKIRAQSRIDVDKDLLGNIGPKMALYLAPGRSAAATDESAALPTPGADPMAMLSSLQGVIPKPTLVVEVQDPVSFTKALDAVMVAVNKELKALAIEKAAQEPPPANGPQANLGRNDGGGDRPARKRSSRETPAPEFRLMPGSVKTYMLVVPPDSPLKLVPQGVRPTIRTEGKLVAFASTSDAARAGLEAAKKKDWKPTPDVEEALSHVPSDPVFVAVGDPRETLPPVLASLPGTLQTVINSVIATTAPGASPARPGATAGGAPPPGISTGSSGMMQRPGLGGPGRLGRNDDVGGPPGGQGGPPSGYAAMMGRQGSSAGYPGSQGPQPGGQPGSNQMAMIQIKVDAAKLPKAEDLKALMFPGTFWISVDDQSVRFVNRESFPNLVNSAAVGGVAGALLMPAIQAARAKAREAMAAKAAKAAEAAAAGQPGQPGQPGGPGQGGPGRFGQGPGGAQPGAQPGRGAGGRGGRGARSLDD